MPAVPPPGSGPRLWEAMPRPLLVVFALVCAAALVAAVVLIVAPPDRSEVGLFERRPPPAGDLTHGVGEIRPVVPPRTQVPLDPPCPEVEGVRAIAGPAGVARIRSVLAQVCKLAAGVSDEMTGAVRNLSGTVRFADFERSGVDAATDEVSSTIYLNVRFASRDIPVTHVAPLLLHEAAHGPVSLETTCPGGPPPRPGEPSPESREPPAGSFGGCILDEAGVGAEDELFARRVELEACRYLIPSPDWPRWCLDAQEITNMPREEALRGLRAAGYA